MKAENRKDELIDAALENVRKLRNKFAASQSEPNTVTDDELDKVIEDICILEERITMHYQATRPLMDSIEKLQQRQRNAIRHLFQQTQAVGVSRDKLIEIMMNCSEAGALNNDGKEITAVEFNITKAVNVLDELLNQKK